MPTKTFFIAALLLLTQFFSFAQHPYYSEIKQTAISLFQSFSKLQQLSGMLQFNDTARIKWNNLPVGLRARAGTSIGQMTDYQRKLVHRILSVSLSSQGYLKATSIIHLDELLNRYYENLFDKKEIDDTTYSFVKSLLWSPKNYFFAFFGQPTTNTWGISWKDTTCP